MRLNRLRLVRAPGINVPFTLEAAPGLNLVTGPNGAGKSTLCRAVRSLLWPDTVALAPFEAEAEFEMGGAGLRVSRRDAESPLWEGGPRPNLGPDHLADRYRLGVLDLMRPEAQHDPLAREIRRHMAGGFDLAALRDALFPFRTGQGENRELKKTLATAARLRHEQQSLAIEQDRLAELEQERALAGNAHRRQAVLEARLDLLRKTAVRDQAAALLADLPDACARVREEDPRRLKDLLRRQRDLELGIQDRKAALATIDAERAEIGRHGGLAAGFPLELLDRKRDTLDELRREIRHAENDSGGPHQDAVLEEAAARPGRLSVVLLLVAGAALIAAGLALPLPGPFLPLALVAIGGGAGGAGIRGLYNHSRSAGQAARALEKRQEIARKKDHLEQCRRRYDEALGSFNRELEGAGLAPVADDVQAAQRLQEIAGLRDRARALESDRTNEEAFLKRDRLDLDGAAAEIREILERLELEGGPGAEAGAMRLLELRPRYVKAVHDRDDAARDIERLGRRLEEEAHLPAEGETADLTEEGLTRLIAVEEQRAAALGSLEKEIARIEAAVGVARNGHDLQEAQAASTSALAALAEARDGNRASLLGRFLLDQIERQHEMESRPLVLEKAADYFRLFTGGRYGLRLAAQGDGGDRFQALAEDSTRPLELAELSDGTRAQLLLAVKLAFMTVAEEGARPPIFLDDSLTSADPDRFAAVAVSLGRLADDEERQIFYLTPNPADGAAFRRALAGAGLPAPRHVDLAEVRGIAGAADPALLDPSNLPANILAPEPAGMNPAEYAAALRVPRPDPWARRQALHVFFVAGGDLDLVRRLVDGNAPTLGRFLVNRETLVDAGVITPAESALVSAGGDVWGAWLDGWRVGRARPVTREFLGKSAAVSENFLDQVAGVLEECRGDGGRLLEAIAARKVKGFRSNKEEQLRQELEDADLLAHGAPLTGGEILDQVLARVAPALAAGVLDMQKVRTMALTFAQMFENFGEPASPPSS